MSSQSPSYPPRSDKLDQIEAALKALAHEYGARLLIYLSTPITTGKRYYEFLRSVGRDLPPEQFDEMRRRQVIEPNMAAARLVRERLTARLNEPVIDPTAGNYTKWNQEDYKARWANVIERFGRAVAFGEGGQDSNRGASSILLA